MNKENMLKWAAVLESGKYNQYQGGWGGSEFSGYCCLNVALVEFAGKEYDVIPDDTPALVEAFGWSENVPAIEFFNSEEFNNIMAGDQKENDIKNHFITCNDTLKMSFPEIAAKIREFVNAN